MLHSPFSETKTSLLSQTSLNHIYFHGWLVFVFCTGFMYKYNFHVHTHWSLVQSTVYSSVIGKAHGGKYSVVQHCSIFCELGDHY